MRRLLLQLSLGWLVAMTGLPAVAQSVGFDAQPSYRSQTDEPTPADRYSNSPSVYPAFTPAAPQANTPASSPSNMVAAPEMRSEAPRYEPSLGTGAVGARAPTPAQASAPAETTAASMPTALNPAATMPPVPSDSTTSPGPGPGIPPAEAPPSSLPTSPGTRSFAPADSGAPVAGYDASARQVGGELRESSPVRHALAEQPLSNLRQDSEAAAANPSTMRADPHVVPASKSETRLEADPEALPLRRTGKEKSGVPAGRGARSGGASGASIVTVASSLLIVVGLFLLVAWGLRRAGPQRVRALPAEVVEVLGRTALGPRHFLQVVRFGNKLVLVSLTTGHAETLSEITDEEEVDRLMGMCAQKAKGSASASFDQMLNSMNREQTGSVLLNHIREKLVRRAAQQNAGEVDNAV